MGQTLINPEQQTKSFNNDIVIQITKKQLIKFLQFIVVISIMIVNILAINISSPFIEELFLSQAILLLIFLRKHFKNTLKGEIYKEREDYIGAERKVIETVNENKPGRILYQGTTWTAYSDHGKFNKNQKAKILGKKPGEPMVFKISKITKGE